MAHVKMEEARVAIRQVRKSERGTWEKDQEDGKFGEDELDRRDKILQELIDKSIGQVEELGKAKEEELVQV